MGLLMLSSRAPYAEVDGTWQASVGGLTAALDPVMTARGGTWLAQGHGPDVSLPPGRGAYRLRSVVSTPDDAERYYNGAANGTLWPLCHGFLDRVTYEAADWDAYRQVNQDFALAAGDLYRRGDAVWVHDYQLALVPGALRAQHPDARIGLFWHIPWPSVDMLLTLPWREELLESILAADVVGLHTERDADKLARAANAVLGAEIAGNQLRWRHRVIDLLVDPISVDPDPFEQARISPEVGRAARALSHALGGTVLLSVDRLDYSKGLPQRLQTFDRFLAETPEAHGQVTFVQIASPSREGIEQYQIYRAEVEALVQDINGRYARQDWTPVHYVNETVSKDDLAVYYRAADVMWVTPLRDGLNLVAKEFVCASEHGVLILSEFAGAAAELQEALLVNPYDEQGMLETLHFALSLPMALRREQVAALHERVHARDVHAWAQTFLDVLTPATPVHA